MCHYLITPPYALVLLLSLSSRRDLLLLLPVLLPATPNKRHLDRRRRTLPPQWRDPCISVLALVSSLRKIPVKPPSTLTPTQSMTSTWRTSSPQPAIINTESKKAPAKAGAFPINTNKPPEMNTLPIKYLE